LLAGDHLQPFLVSVETDEGDLGEGAEEPMEGARCFQLYIREFSNDDGGVSGHDLLQGIGVPIVYSLDAAGLQVLSQTTGNAFDEY
jgi:hypothetical protein